MCCREDDGLQSAVLSGKCGFLSGKDELTNWEPSDLFQFYYDTTPILGTLDELLKMIDQAAIDRAIKIGACILRSEAKKGIGNHTEYSGYIR